MLGFNVYKNSLYMMVHRGFEEADFLLKDLEKEPVTTYISGSRYHSIGYDFKSHLRSDIKEYEDRFLMSYAVSDQRTMKKAYVIFGVSSKAFLEVVSDIIINSLIKDKDYSVSYSFFVSKDYNKKFTEKIDEINSKVDLRIYLDHNFLKPPFHAYTPRFSLLSEDEVSIMLKELHLTKKQPKKIKFDCPIISYFGYKRGDVVRIHRTPIIAGSLLKNTLDYRMVV